MKKLFAILALAALVAAPAQAKIFGFGLAAGMNITKPTGGDFELDPSGGWYAGLKAKVTIPAVGIGVDGALLYSLEEVTINDESDKISYVSIPVNLRYEFQLPVVNKVVTPFLAAGPQFNYACNDLDLKAAKVSDPTDVSQLENSGDALKKAFDTENAQWKLNLGLGAIVFNHLEVSYTYGLPLGKSFKENFSEYGLSNYKNVKTGTHRIGVAYYF
ncbi:MAG: outer membrane beta-barrel protein [Bacteroidales bacterium]|nr:outer membrane beta-barrel protein [Bacteroidales bacterium]